MSRTDAHAPIDVRIARREIAVVAAHRCGGPGCDLPDRFVGRAGRCHWQLVYTGVKVCSCWMCHWHSRPEEGRSAVRSRLRDEARAWNAGLREL
ncbi:hypothetical protein [Mycobacterium sp. pW045]|uniref:hypothetical protein n=1 Tax=Mycobacterium sp. pW045 TaxID=3238984 RepID=UPI00351B41C9